MPLVVEKTKQHQQGDFVETMDEATATFDMNINSSPQPLMQIPSSHAPTTKNNQQQKEGIALCQPVLSVVKNKNNTNTSPHTNKEIYQTHFTSRRPKRSCTEGNKQEVHVNNCRLTSAAAMFCSQECANDKCLNQRVKRNNWKRTVVHETEEKGKGVYSGTIIKKNEIIMEYRGAIIDEWDLKRQQKCQASLYVALCDGWLVDSRNCTSSHARYINHSCDPNCELQQFGLDGKTAKYLYIVARRNIQKDEELTYDYQWNVSAGRHPTKCKCASVKCRGTIEVFT
eukprot:scaffold1660_cov170-Skeletonema_dohrnii-CCMP3373.AAC.4